MQIELTPTARIGHDEIHRDRDDRFIECQRTFDAVIGDKFNKIIETYTNHPKWNGVYRVEYKIDFDMDSTEVFICWFTEKGIAISVGG